MWFIKLISEFNKVKVKYAVAGGYAVAFHGAVRGTIDIDFCIQVNKKNLELIVSILTSAGFASRIPITAKDLLQFRSEYIEKRNLIAWSFVHKAQPSQVVDLLIHVDLEDFKTITMNIAGERVSVLAIESLIKLKSNTGRPQDKEDIAALRQILEGKK